jgi:imidazole glycerol-phosphate synthase subunit HisH
VTPPREVVIVDSGGANLASVRAAFERLGASVHVSGDAAEIRAAERVVLPGVGAARPAMQRLAALGLDAVIPALEQPVLGICIGMQLFYEASEEGATACLGVLPGRVRALDRAACGRVPHMGWNRVVPRRASPLLDGIEPGEHAYFVHGYATDDGGDDVVASCDYGAPFAAIVSRRNFHGVQFHPERSATFGSRLLRNWLALA